MKTVKTMLAAAVLMAVGMPVMAMQLQPLEQLGWLYPGSAGSAYLAVGRQHGESDNQVEEMDDRGRPARGRARYGDSQDGMYVYYDSHAKWEGRVQVGGSQNTNAYDVGINDWGVYRMRSDSGITFYFLESVDKLQPVNWTLYGVLPNGRFVKYFNTAELGSQYLGSGNGKGFGFNEPQVKGDTIVIPYRASMAGNAVPIGELRFQWDDGAQWFGVENVPY